MIKTLITHKITEFAIKAFFKHVNDNFNITKMPKFYVGQKLKRIKFEELKTNNRSIKSFYNVDILDVTPEYITIIAVNMEYKIVDKDTGNIIAAAHSYNAIWTILIDNISEFY